MNQLELDIAREVPSWNTFLGHSHWLMTNEKRKWYKETSMAIIVAGANGKIPQSFKENITKRMVTVTAYRKRSIDTDNVCLKPVMDALVTAGVLRDDSRKWCDLLVKQEKCKKKEPPHTVVIIEEALKERR